jgi:hypothetical protein
MKLKEIYEYDYDSLSGNLHIEFSLKGDSDESYRVTKLTEDEITDSITNPTILEEYDLEELMEDWDFVEDLFQYYIENICEDLPPEEFL